MDAPQFLTNEEVLEIHADQLQRYGGAAGLRDSALLEAAVAAARAGMGGEFFHKDLFEMAAALLYALVKNHAFVDGNKRVGTAAALVFLSVNGIEIRPGEPELSDLVIAVATGTVSRGEVASYFRSHIENA